MAKLTTEEFIAAIKELSVVELNDLVKAVEAGADFINSSTVNPERTVTYAPPSGVFLNYVRL